jgi:hypothetical protein
VDRRCDAAAATEAEYVPKKTENPNSIEFY